MGAFVQVSDVYGGIKQNREPTYPSTFDKGKLGRGFRERMAYKNWIMHCMKRRQTRIEIGQCELRTICRITLGSDKMLENMSFISRTILFSFACREPTL